MTPEKTQQLRSDNPDPVIAAILSSIVAVGNPTQTGDVLEEVDGLVTQPLRWFREHIHWPTGMGSHGIPVEVSVSVKEPGHPSFRLLADPQDHRFHLAGNWANYLKAGIRITGAPGARVALLMSQHLDIDPPNTRTPVYHGIRYGRNGRHASLYFSTVTWPPDLVLERIPASTEIGELRQEGPNAPWVHLVGYDFDETGSIYRTKLYAWLDRDGPLQRLSDTLCDAPGVAIAQGLLDHLMKVKRMATPQESTLMQFSLSGNRQPWTRKLYLHAPKWKFDNADGLGEVVRYMACQWGADVSSLMDVLTIFSSYGVPLLPSGIAIGLSAQVPPPFTFYFVPTTESPPASSGVTRAKLRAIYRKSTRAILRQAGRNWTDIPDRGRGETISRIRLALSSQLEVRSELAQLNIAELSGWADDTCGLREALTCVRLGISVDTGGHEVSGSQPELAALSLLVKLESKCGSDAEILRAVESMVAQERWGGGWIGPGGELEVTIVVLEALLKALTGRPWLASHVTPVLQRTIHWLRALPVPREPARVAMWIKGNVLTGETRCRLSVDRGLAFLAACQQEDGTWLPSAFETAAGDRACVDAHGWLATALVSECLASFV